MSRNVSVQNYSGNQYSNSSNWLENGTSGFTFEISVYSQITNVVISVLTILVNSIMLLCLKTHGRKLPRVLRYQTLSLCVSDLISGLSPGLAALTFFPEVNNRSITCITILSVFYTCQMATLNNLTLLCIRRFYIMKVDIMHLRNYRSARNVVKVLFVSSWLFSFLSNSPFLFMATEHDTVDGCLSTRLFKSDYYYSVFLNYSTILPCVSVIILNIFYILLIRYMKQRLSRNKGIESFRESKRNVKAASVATTSASLKLSQLIINNLDVLTIVSVGTIEPNILRDKGRPGRPNLTIQRQALRHLSTVLIVTNICTLPYIVVSMLIASGNIPVDPKSSLIIDVHLLSMNALLNPIICGYSVKPLFSVLKDIARCSMKSNKQNAFNNNVF